MTDEEWKDTVATKTAERDVARADSLRYLKAYTKASEKLAKAREAVAGATTSTVPERDLSELLAELRAVLGDK